MIFSKINGFRKFGKIVLCAVTACFMSCEDAKEVVYIGNWVYADVSGFRAPRTYGVGVTIDSDNDGMDDQLYYGLGWDGTTDGSKGRLSDWWIFQPDEDLMLRKPSFPGEARQGAVAFAIGTKIYVGTGYDGINYYKDFYCFDTQTNTWSAKDEIPPLPVAENEEGRWEGVAFSINGKGYVGTGYSAYLNEFGNIAFDCNNDFYCYDPESNTWSPVSSAGSKRRDAVVFIIDNEAYLCTGRNANGNPGDFHKFNPQTGQWTELRDIYNSSPFQDDTYDDLYTDIRRYGAAAWAVNGRGYVATGSPATGLKSVWEYNPQNDLWQKKAPFEGRQGRMGAIGFALNGYGYILGGMSNTSGGSYFSDIWYFQPNSVRIYDDNGAVE